MTVNYNDLPDWAVEMSDEQWEKDKLKYESHANCEECNARLLITMCDHSEPKKYCVVHCPKHLWQTTYDWPVECAHCGINYTQYLEFMLEKNDIEFNSDNWKVDDS